MRVLVTGSTGFVGRRLMPALRERDADVRVLVRHGLLGNADGDGVERVRGDVTDAASLASAAEGCELIYHLAWGGMTFEEQAAINVEGTRNVMKAAESAGVRRVVHLSTMAVHGASLPNLLRENAPMVTVSTSNDPYAVTKADGERLAFEMGRRAGIEVVALRPSVIYGPGAPLWVTSYFERVATERVLLIGGGRTRVNLVHVDDVVDAILAAGSRANAAGQAFLIGGEESVSWRELLARYAAMCGKPVPPSMPAWVARGLAPFTKIHGLITQRAPLVSGVDLALMLQDANVCIDKARGILGYRPRIDFERGMQDCERWLRETGYLPGRATHLDALVPETETPAVMEERTVPTVAA